MVPAIPRAGLNANTVAVALPAGSRTGIPLVRPSVVSRRRRARFSNGLHRRTPGIVADLFIGWERFLGFAHETEALTRNEAEVYRARVWSALIELAHRQSQHQREENPVDLFFALLRSAIASGRAQVATRDGGMPDNPGAWGWPRRASRMAGWSGSFPGHRLRVPRCKRDGRGRRRHRGRSPNPDQAPP